ncbi:tetratricopeptide repeat protein [Streptosporangium soli]|nr:serine/threonine-protein kinase PknG [Streptosporangium sp. KLBMP 9127]
MTQCTHPGCTGTVQDGYCDSCGLAPPAQPAAPPAWPAQPPNAPQHARQPSAPSYGQPGTPQYGQPAAPQYGQPGTSYPPAPRHAQQQPPPPSQQPPPPGQQANPQQANPQQAQPPSAPVSAWRATPGSAPVSGWRATPGSAPVSSWRATPGLDLGTMPAAGPGSGRTTSSTRARRGLLGAGLVAVPPVPYRDPSEVVLHNPEVPEEKRYCSNANCGQPVGRAKGDRPGRPEGFCPHCGTRFSFTPKLREGDLVAGQYEVKGCLAHGGLGWIYLAADRNLDGRWVVMKGLLDTGDVEALLAAEAERRFLTGVDHANIVKIFNFVQHPDPGTGTMVGYIVMEYVGGQPLQEMLRDRLRASGNRDALPLGQAIAYVLEVLRAFDYLHDRGLLYCDLKPANVIQVEDQLKLIDLGAVRRHDDQDSSIYGTVGYQAPEIAKDGPTVSSDLYTVGRMLAVLSFPFSPVTGGEATPLPAPGKVPVLAGHESYVRFLHRSTDPQPARRFATAEEMSEQLTGVLREIRAVEDGIPYPAPSTQFGPERVAAGTALATDDDGTPGRVLVPLDPSSAVGALPTPLVDPADPAASYLAGITARTLDDLVTMLRGAPADSIEARLALIRALIEQRNPAVGEVLEQAARETPWDWRVLWYHGLRDLAWGNMADATRIFDELYYRMPGEPATKLALAFARECAGEPREAARLYGTIWRTDRSYVSAAFGLARVRLVEDDRIGATRVLDEVPTTSSHHIAAQMAAVAIAVRGRDPKALPVAELIGAGERLNDLGLDAGRRHRLAAEVLTTALGWLEAGQRPRGQTPPLLDAPLTEKGVRKELERVYRTLARSSGVRQDRHAFVDKANSIRPRTWA